MVAGSRYQTRPAFESLSAKPSRWKLAVTWLVFPCPLKRVTNPCATRIHPSPFRGISPFIESNVRISKFFVPTFFYVLRRSEYLTLVETNATIRPEVNFPKTLVHIVVIKIQIFAQIYIFVTIIKEVNRSLDSLNFIH